MRVAMISAHTSPLAQPGTGDAGGMNVYIAELARALGRRGAEVEVFTRRTYLTELDRVELSDGVTVRTVLAGPIENLPRTDLPAHMCSFAADLLRYESARRPGWFDLVHTHYWLSALPGALVADRWRTPLVHTMHTVAASKNLNLAPHDIPEPKARLDAEREVVREADRLIASTPGEANDLREQYGASDTQVAVIPPGVDLRSFRPAWRVETAAAAALSPVSPSLIAPRANGRPLVVFAGRIQRLKGTEVLIRALAHWEEAWRRRTVDVPAPQLIIAGGTSGPGKDVERLRTLASQLRVDDLISWSSPLPHLQLAEVFRAADLVAVPSYYETFGLVALEAQACGTPVVATDVGGLATVVRDGVTGRLISGHDPGAWATVMQDLIRDEPGRLAMGRAAAQHAATFTWDLTATRTMNLYSQAVSLAVRSAS